MICSTILPCNTVFQRSGVLFQVGIFYSKLICINGGKRVELDALTSDAIALALRFECNINTTTNYCGFDPYTGEKLYVAREKEEKLKQKAYIS